MEGTCCCGAGKRRDAEDWEIEKGLHGGRMDTELRATRRWITRNRVHILCLPSPDSRLTSHFYRPHSRNSFTLSYPGTKVTSDDHPPFHSFWTRLELLTSKKPEPRHKPVKAHLQNLLAETLHSHRE